MTPERLKNYEVPQDHEQVMLRMCGLGTTDDLPATVREAYIKTRIASDRIQFTLNDRDLINIVVRGTPGGVPVKSAPSILSLIKDGKLNPGDDILVTWRNKKNTPAKVVGATTDRVTVRINGKVDDVNVQPHFVYLEQKT